jgi:iron complex transport system permease protein
LLLTLLWGSAQVPAGEVLRILLGQESQPAWESIVLRLRLPRALAAVLIGASLGLAGLELQTLFRNPLAEPFVLGVSAGASLGVAAMVLAGGGALDLFGVPGLLGGLGMVGAAALGAGAILALMLVVASRVSEVSVVLVLGVVLAAIVGALVTVLVFLADPERTRAFVEWGFGSFARVTLEDLAVLAPVLGLGVALALFSIKDLNALLLGESYARTLGIAVPTARLKILLSASLLAAGTVAFAGPIGFLGIAVPHLARGLFASADHRRLVPATLLLGALFGLGCGLLAELPGSATLFPVNAATALLCGPMVFWVLLRLAREGGV